MKSYGGGKNNSPEGAAVSVTMSVRVAQLTKSGWPPIWVRLRVWVRDRQRLLSEQRSLSSEICRGCGKDCRQGHCLWLRAWRLVM